MWSAAALYASRLLTGVIQRPNQSPLMQVAARGSGDASSSDSSDSQADPLEQQRLARQEQRRK